MTDKEAMKLALDALETECDIYCENNEDGAPEYILEAITALKERVADPMREVQRLGQEIEQEPVAKYCCRLCFNKSGSLLLDRMILCSECGNKRCPKATNHELQCTNSNEPNQAGSIYNTPPQRTETIQSLQCFHCQVTIETLNDKVMHLLAQRKPLTEEQIWKAIRPLATTDQLCKKLIDISMDEYRAIEAAHGIKENT